MRFCIDNIKLIRPLHSVRHARCTRCMSSCSPHGSDRPPDAFRALMTSPHSNFHFERTTENRPNARASIARLCNVHEMFSASLTLFPTGARVRPLNWLSLRLCVAFATQFSNWTRLYHFSSVHLPVACCCCCCRRRHRVVVVGVARIQCMSSRITLQTEIMLDVVMVRCTLVAGIDRYLR